MIPPDETAAQGFAGKLRVTASFLECGTVKELCARFRLGNPATAFSADRVYKWMQGRSMPRGGSIYAEWIAVLHLKRPASWLAACSVDALIMELVTVHGADANSLAALQRSTPGSVAVKPVPMNAERWVFACYSPAFSPYRAGQLIRGTLVLETSDSPADGRATYTETWPTGGCRLVCPWKRDGAPLLLNLREAGGGDQAIFITLNPATRFVSVLCGIISGFNLMGGDPEPTAARFIGVAVPASAEIVRGGERYMRLDDETIAADLEALGMTIEDQAPLEALLRRVLAPPRASMAGDDMMMILTRGDRRALQTVFDPMLIDAASRTPPRRAAE